MCIHQLEEKVPVVAPRIVAGDGVVGQPAQGLRLAARAEGIGMGWVSILDPAEVKGALDVPTEWTLIGYFCLGYPLAESDTPTLETDGWECRAKSGSTVLRR